MADPDGGIDSSNQLFPAKLDSPSTNSVCLDVLMRACGNSVICQNHNNNQVKKKHADRETTQGTPQISRKVRLQRRSGRRRELGQDDNFLLYEDSR